MNFTSKKLTFTSDNLTLVGYYYAPDNVSTPPGILFLHGAEASTSQRFKLWQPYLAERGIASFAFDYRECGEPFGVYTLSKSLTEEPQLLHFPS